MTRVPFNVPPIAGREIEYLSQVLKQREFSGNGTFTGRCQNWLEERLGTNTALLTHSCTAALEMAAILAGLEPGDEVIMPSFTFVSTANAVVLRGAIPVFTDIRQDTLNIDEDLIAAAITSRTKAICVVHYAGVCAEMDAINELARKHGLVVIEDAAQALMSTYRGIPAGRLGALACFSFHETKNATAGEGGALTINNPRFDECAFIVWEKGTNRRAFRHGLVDKYSWVSLGSSFLPSEFVAAVLLAQLEEVERFTNNRRATWERYYAGFAGLEAAGHIRRPVVPTHCRHNGHLFYLLLRNQNERDQLLQWLRKEDILAPFHYVPLHSSVAGQRYGRPHGNMSITDRASAALLRLPLYAGMPESFVEEIIERVEAFFLG